MSSSSRILLMVINVDWFFISHRLEIAKAAAQAGWSVHIATTLTERSDALDGYGFHVHPLTMHRTSSGPLGLLRLLVDMIRLFQTVKPTVLHLVTIKPVLIGGLAARIARVHSVVYAVSGLGHVFTSRGVIGGLRRALVRVGYRVALGAKRRRVIFQNSFDASEVQQSAGVAEGESVMIPGSGFDVDSYSVVPPPEGSPVFMMASRLIRTKGVLEFCAAAEVLNREGVQAEFWLVGESDLINPAGVTADELREVSERGAVQILGFQRNVPGLMDQAHVVVLPSYYAEGLPKVLIEAAASGRPVITTDMPGCREAVEPGLTGLVVPPRDPEALADAMRKLANNADLRQSMGLAGRHRAEQLFRIQDVVERHIALYSQLAEEA